MVGVIELELEQVPEQVRRAFGRVPYSVRVVERVEVPRTAGLWDGGCRDTYSVVHLGSGEARGVPGQGLYLSGQDQDIALRPGFAIAQRCENGPRVRVVLWVHPSDAAPMLPASPAVLTKTEKLVLLGMRLTASYQGKNRWQMMASEVGGGLPVTAKDGYPTEAEWEAGRLVLVRLGYVKPRGGLTPAGRNALSGLNAYTVWREPVVPEIKVVP